MVKERFGLIGGVGPQTTVPYYEGIVYGVQEALGRHYFPKFSIESLSCFDVFAISERGSRAELVEYFLGGLRRLAASGATFAAMACVTGHTVLPELRRSSPIPILGIFDAPLERMRGDGIGRFLLLGTKATMNSPYFRGVFAEAGIEAVSPDAADQDGLARVIGEELEFGKVTEESVRAVREMVCRTMRDRQADAVLLGCTELPLLFARIQLEAPVIDPVRMHIEAIVSRIAQSVRDGAYC